MILELVPYSATLLVVVPGSAHAFISVPAILLNKEAAESNMVIQWPIEESISTAAICIKNNKNFGSYILAIFYTNCYNNINLCGIFE